MSVEDHQLSSTCVVPVSHLHGIRCHGNNSDSVVTMTTSTDHSSVVDEVEPGNTTETRLNVRQNISLVRELLTTSHGQSMAGKQWH